MTLYAPHDIAIGYSLLYLNYAYVSIAVIWVYDYLVTFDDELEFLLNSKLGTYKILYLLCRYLPFALLAADTYQVLQPAIPLSRCGMYFNINSYLQGITLVAAECMFILRTYSIWGRSRQILIILMGSLAAIMIPVIYVVINFNNSMKLFDPPIPNITSCYNVDESPIIVVAYVVLIIGEFEILIFTIYRSIKHYQSLGSDNPLLKILIQHNIFYCACGLVFSLSVILTVWLLPGVYSDMASNLQVTVHALLGTRMHLGLWKSDRVKKFILDDIPLAILYPTPGNPDPHPNDHVLHIAPT